MCRTVTKDIRYTVVYEPLGIDNVIISILLTDVPLFGVLYNENTRNHFHYINYYRI